MRIPGAVRVLGLALLAACGASGPTSDGGPITVADGTLATGLGVRGTLHLLPEELRVFYGSRTPVGLVVHVHVRPGRELPTGS